MSSSGTQNFNTSKKKEMSSCPIDSLQNQAQAVEVLLLTFLSLYICG